MKRTRRLTNVLLAVSALALGAAVSACTPGAAQTGCGAIASPTYVDGGYVKFAYSNDCAHADSPVAIERLIMGVPFTVRAGALLAGSTSIELAANLCAIGQGTFRSRWTENGLTYYTSNVTITTSEYAPSCM